MKFLRLIVCVLLGSVLCDLPQARGQEVAVQTVGKLRVATWNLLNLFDNYDHPIKPDEGTAPKSVADLRALARVIDALDADVLGVQEVENRSVLENLNVHLKKPFLHIELMEGNDFRGIDVGVMSRLPIEKSTSHRLRPLAGDHLFSRDFPVFRIRLSKNSTFDFGVVHLKSKRGKKERSDAWRSAEANEIAVIAKELKGEPGNLGLVVVGDFNDYRDSQPLAKLMSGFVDHTTSIPVKERFTFIYRGKGEQIDFVLSTQGMKSNNARIHRDIDFASDHFPVVVEFAVPEKVVRPIVPQGKPFQEPTRPTLAATDLKTAKARLLQEVEVFGTVDKVYRPKNGGSASINFHKQYKQAVVAYIPKKALERMGDLDQLVGKKIKVRGPLSMHRDVFQIVVTRKEQIVAK